MKKLKKSIKALDTGNRLSVVLLGKKSDFIVYKFGEDGRLTNDSKLPSIKKNIRKEILEEFVFIIYVFNRILFDIK